MGGGIRCFLKDLFYLKALDYYIIICFDLYCYFNILCVYPSTDWCEIFLGIDCILNGHLYESLLDESTVSEDCGASTKAG